MPRSKDNTTNTPAPLAVQKHFDSLGLLPYAATRLLLWQDLVRFHEDPLHEYRKYMNLSQNREQLKTEVHKFLRQHGERYFSERNLKPGIAVYKENPVTEEIFPAYKPLYEALLYLCRRANQKRNQERNKRDWKQWEAVRSSINLASGHDGMRPRETIAIDNEIFIPQSDSDSDYIPPERPSDIVSSPSREASPGYKASGSRRAQVDSTTACQKSARTIWRKQGAALYSRLLISSDDAEPLSPPTQQPPNPSILESERRQLFPSSSQEAPITRGAAARFASATSTLGPYLNLERSESPMYEEVQPSSQQNDTQSSDNSISDPASNRPVPCNTVPSSIVEPPIRNPGVHPGLQPRGNPSRMPDQRRNSIDEFTGTHSTFRMASPQSTPRHPGIENTKKRPRNDSTSLIPENQGGPAKFNGTIRHRPGQDHGKSNYKHPRPAVSKQSSTTTVAGGHVAEPCERTFTPINTECGLQESVSSNGIRTTVPRGVDEPHNYSTPSGDMVLDCYDRPAEPIGIEPPGPTTPTQQSVQPPVGNNSTVEDAATRNKTASRPSLTDPPAQTKDDRNSGHRSSAVNPTLQSRKAIYISDRPKRNVKVNISIWNRDGILVPWSYDKLSNTTPEDLLARIAEDYSLPPEKMVGIEFSILGTTKQRSLIVARDSVQPGAALKSMVTEFSKGRKGLEVCEVLAQPMACEDVDSEVEVEDL